MTSLLICWKRNGTSQSTKINPCKQQCMVMDRLQHFIGSIIIRECIPCLLLRLMCTLVHVHSSAAIELVLDTSLSIWSNYSRWRKNGNGGRICTISWFGCSSVEIWSDISSQWLNCCMYTWKWVCWTCKVIYF